MLKPPLMNNCFINSASPNHLRTINNRIVGAYYFRVGKGRVVLYT